MTKSMNLFKCACVLTMAAVLPHVSFARDGAKIQSVLPNSGVTTPGIRVAVSGTGFSPGDNVLFDGIEARETKFVSPTQLDVVTPYLRPGVHRLQVMSGATSARSSTEFSALPSEADAEIDRARESASQGRIDDATALLERIGQTNSDYQVRAAAYYVESQIFFDHGDFEQWGRAADLIYLDADKSGGAVQTFWGYRLAFAQSHYLFGTEGETGFDLRLADQLVQFDVTQSPECRFYRAVLNARSGNLTKAKSDSRFVSEAWPGKSSATALSAYVAAAGGDSAPLRALASGPPPTDATSLSLIGEGLFAAGDATGAARFWSMAGEADPNTAALAYLAGKKHEANGQKTAARLLFTEAAAMAPYSKAGQAAHDALPAVKE